MVVNHHLFFADVMLRDEGTAELLPACNTVIFDEAHQLRKPPACFWRQRVNQRKLLSCCAMRALEGIASARDCLDLPKLCGVVEGQPGSAFDVAG